MTALVYQRNSRRFKVEAPVSIEDFRTGFFYNGTIYNYSADGVYLESDYAPRPGQKIHLNVNGAREFFTSPFHLAEIRWRRLLTDNSSRYSYGFGLKYC